MTTTTTTHGTPAPSGLTAGEAAILAALNNQFAKQHETQVFFGWAMIFGLVFSMGMISFQIWKDVGTSITTMFFLTLFIVVVYNGLFRLLRRIGWIKV